MKSVKEKEGLQQEYSRLKALQGKSQWAGYLPILIVLLSLIYIVDEVASNMKTTMQTEVIYDFFQNGMGLTYNEGLSQINLLLIPASFIIFILPFYKSLADRYGRKLFLIFNTMGMGFGLFLCFVSPTVYVYVVGCMIVAFFQPNDMQVLYIAETVPAKHRAKITSITKAIGMLGVSAIPILRTVFMGDDALLWKNVLIVPILAALIVSVISIFYVRETPIFIRKRMDEIQNQIDKSEGLVDEEEVKDKPKTGVWQALKFIFKHKQIRNTAICGAIFSISTSITSYYVAIMTAGGITTEGLTQALLVYPFLNAAMTGVGGFITDKFGRKRSTLVLGTIAFVALAIFVYGSSAGVNPYILGGLYGIFSGCYWSISDILYLMIPSESSPTHLRASVVGILSIFMILGSIVSSIVIAIAVLFTESLGALCFGICAPFVVISLVLLQIKVHETKGADLDVITGAEYD